MYPSFYGLSESPFELTYNPRFVFFTARHREACSHVENGILSGMPLTVVLGNAGTGKTTLLQTSLQSDRCRPVQCVYLTSATAMRERLVDTLLAELEPSAGPAAAAAPPQALHAVLRKRRAHGLRTALAVDEAEQLTDERLADLCVLVTLQADGVQLLPIVLAGQLALGARLDEPGLAPLKTRATRRCELAPLELAQTASYILWHARAAGAAGNGLFTREAVTLIHECSEGIPRTINVICDNALLVGSSRRLKPVTRDIVREVCGQLDLASPPHAAAASAPGMAMHPTHATV
jgi:general secretion pathway protein A